jgi:hypothetical protein
MMATTNDFRGIPDMFCEQTKNDGVEAAGSENSDRNSETGPRGFWWLDKLNRNVRLRSARAIPPPRYTTEVWK